MKSNPDLYFNCATVSIPSLYFLLSLPEFVHSLELSVGIIFHYCVDDLVECIVRSMISQTFLVLRRFISHVQERKVVSFGCKKKQSL